MTFSLARRAFGAPGTMRVFRASLYVTTLLSSAVAASGSAGAQTLGQLVTQARPVVDPNGVDVNAGVATSTAEESRIADFGFAEMWTGQTPHSTFTAYIAASGTDRIVFLHGVSKRFNLVSGSYVATDRDGSTLVKTSGYENYIYTAPDGSVYYFGNMVGSGPNRPIWNIVKAHLATITRPSGRVYTYNYADTFQPVCTHTCYDAVYVRVQSITTNDGYMLKAGYASSSPGTSYNKLTSAVAINRSVDYCDPYADSCSGLTGSWPSQTISEATSGSVVTRTITDEESNATTVEVTSDNVTEIDRPGSTGDDVAITYDGSGRVGTITRDSATYSYAYSDSGTNRTTTVTEPGSTTVAYVTDIPSSRITSVTNEVGQATTYQYDSYGRRTRETFPEGNYTQWTYDARGNVTEVRRVAKSGSGLADVVTSASFDTSCSNTLTCNQPNYVIDERGNQTDFTYSSTHGGVTRVQLPASASGQPRPEINYTYTSMYAQERNSSGVLVNVGAAQYKVTQITTCATAATCAGTANETRITIAYATPNLLPSSRTAAAGDGSVTATETYAYDQRGNLASVDGPLSGSDDTTYYFYGINRVRRGVIYPDPDGAGARKRRAERYVYYLAGRQLRSVEVGSVTGTAVSDLNGFTADEKIEFTYDANANVTKEERVSGSTTYQVVQYSYDSKKRLECAALRMNPAVFGSLPGSACTAGTAGAYGPDRITKQSYDAADRVTLVQAAYGVSGEQADVTANTYTNNGNVATVTDAEGNRTTYEFDGHDRLGKTRYPSPTTDGVSSTTDYEERVYDAAGNVTSRRLRGYAGDSTKHIDFTYDNLNRLTLKDLPGSEPDATYGYDLLGRLTSASQSGHSLSFTFDALDRNLTQVGPLGTVSYQYDAAGQRTRMTWPDSFYVTYDWSPAGLVTAIRENGAGSGVGVLATFAYDDLGRRTTLTRGNGTVTSYGFDNISRLTSLGQDLAGSGNDVTATFGYNPAAQIVTTTRNNDAYAWGGATNVNRAYTTNGLNQHTQSGATALGYDARGNLTSSGSDSYGYRSENLLTSAPGSVTLAYDPLLRLYETVGSTTTRFQYDGASLVGEYNSSGTLLKRYVHGPGTDEPIVWYEGSGTSDRRFLHADERGSVVAVTNGSGAVLSGGINSYDEYGIPGVNLGRFQYTGQTWLPELGMYHYKARIYSPTLGRFLQTDPIGYADGMNLYAYVRNDPVNHVDPTGLQACKPGPGTDCDWDEPIDVNGRSPWEALPRGSSPGTVGAVSARPTAGEGPQLDPCRVDRQHVALTGGGGGTVHVVFLGVSVSLEVGVSVPADAFFTGDFRSTALLGTFNITGLVGPGAFLGGGPTGSFSSSPTAPKSGASSSRTLNTGGGWGPGFEFSESWPGDIYPGKSGIELGGGGGLRGAYGGYMAKGHKGTLTGVLLRFGC